MDETGRIRVPADLLRELDGLADLAGQSRSYVLREALRTGIARKRLQLALDAYRSGRVSIGRAQAIAEVPFPLFLEECRRAGIVMNYDRADLRRDLNWASLP